MSEQYYSEEKDAEVGDVGQSGKAAKFEEVGELDFSLSPPSSLFVPSPYLPADQPFTSLWTRFQYRRPHRDSRWPAKRFVSEELEENPSIELEAHSSFLLSLPFSQGMKQRHVQAIAIAGTLGTGLFLSSGRVSEIFFNAGSFLRQRPDLLRDSLSKRRSSTQDLRELSLPICLSEVWCGRWCYLWESFLSLPRSREGTSCMQVSRVCPTKKARSSARPHLALLRFS